MEEENDAPIQNVTKVLTGRPLCVLPMVVENDVLIKAVRRKLKGLPIYVLHMVEEDDALTQSARRALKETPLYVLHMVEENDVPIVSHGLILEVVEGNMMVIVLLVSSTSFQRTHEARSFMPIPKRSAFVMRSMNSLRDLSMTSPSTQVTVIAPCDDGLITENSLERLFYAWRRMSLLIENMIQKMKRSDTTISSWFIVENGSLSVSILMAREWIWRINSLASWRKFRFK